MSDDEDYADDGDEGAYSGDEDYLDVVDEEQRAKAAAEAEKQAAAEAEQQAELARARAVADAKEAQQRPAALGRRGAIRGWAAPVRQRQRCGGV
jgi:hypothetical protein